MEIIEPPRQQPPKQELPNASAVLILGIASLVGCCLSYGVIGIVCAIIALILAKSAQELYGANPSLYTEASYKNMSAGRTCAYISLILSIVMLVATLVAVFVFGVAIFSLAVPFP